MNCKPGDLAITRGSFSHIIEHGSGIILRLADAAPFPAPGGWHWRLDESVTVRSRVADSSCGVQVGDYLLVHFWPDADLRPLRDSDGQDETLSWARAEVLR